MIRLHITYQLEPDGIRIPLHIVSSLRSVCEETFKAGHEDELESQKPYISNLIWGSIGFAVNQKIYTPSVECVIEFENGSMTEVPRTTIYYVQEQIV